MLVSSKDAGTVVDDSPARQSEGSRRVQQCGQDCQVRHPCNGYVPYSGPVGIRVEVARLADLVAEASAPVSAWEQRLYEALRQIDHVNDLGWWDTRYRHVFWHGTSEQGLAISQTVRLFDAIFDFGTCNLYGRFDEQRTAEEYAALIDQLSEELGQPVPSSPPPTNW